VRCPCGSGRVDDDCCGPLLAGTRAAATPEQLMRSRYTASVRQDAAYLLATWHARTRPSRLALDPVRTWTGLEVLASTGGLLADEGTVSFRAHYRDGRLGGVQAECSAFLRVAGRWTYTGSVDGRQPRSSAWKSAE